MRLSFDTTQGERQRGYGGGKERERERVKEYSDSVNKLLRICGEEGADMFQ